MGIVCSLLGHKWRNCTCERCGDKRSSNHDYTGCKCAVCGHKRNSNHSWSGCVCTVCDAKRDEEHEVRDCVCVLCGKEFHSPVNGFCSSCGKSVVDYKSWGTFKETGYSGHTIEHSFKFEDQNCRRCGTMTPHLLVYNFYAGKKREKSCDCIACGKVLYCERCKKYVPTITEVDNFDGALTVSGYRCALCNAFFSRRG